MLQVIRILPALFIAAAVKAQTPPAVFAVPVQFPAGPPSGDVASPTAAPVSGDFNHDGYKDIALPARSGVFVVLGGPHGFSAPARYPISGVGLSIAAADLTGTEISIWP